MHFIGITYCNLRGCFRASVVLDSFHKRQRLGPRLVALSELVDLRALGQILRASDIRADRSYSNDK